jgi:phosphate uptake regulator
MKPTPLPKLETDKAARQLALAHTNTVKDADRLYNSILKLIAKAMQEAQQ